MNMYDLITGFPEQLQQAGVIFSQHKLKSFDKTFSNVFISGMGGSGIGGTMLSELALGMAKVPVFVGKDYHIPQWVSEDTLCIISSYSGNTEETLQAMEACIERKAFIACISSGGLISELAHEFHFPLITIPGGFPPRACLGFSMVQVSGILAHAGIIPSISTDIENASLLLKENQNAMMLEAEAIARSISFSIPVIYTTPGYEGIAIRLRQQLNENAKMLCWHHLIPEMNHNELVGWAEKAPKLAAVFLRNEDEFHRNTFRINLCQEIISSSAGKTHVLNSMGRNRVERLLYWIHLGDWISWYCAVERHTDAMEIDVIIRLKDELAKVQ